MYLRKILIILLIFTLHIFFICFNFITACSVFKRWSILITRHGAFTIYEWDLFFTLWKYCLQTFSVRFFGFILIFFKLYQNYWKAYISCSEWTWLYPLRWTFAMSVWASIWRSSWLMQFTMTSSSVNRVSCPIWIHFNSLFCLKTCGLRVLIMYIKTFIESQPAKILMTLFRLFSFYFEDSPYYPPGCHSVLIWIWHPFIIKCVSQYFYEINSPLKSKELEQCICVEWSCFCVFQE